MSGTWGRMSMDERILYMGRTKEEKQASAMRGEANRLRMEAEYKNPLPRRQPRTRGKQNTTVPHSSTRRG